MYDVTFSTIYIFRETEIEHINYQGEPFEDKRKPGDIEIHLGVI